MTSCLGSSYAVGDARDRLMGRDGRYEPSSARTDDPEQLIS